MVSIPYKRVINYWPRLYKTVAKSVSIPYKRVINKTICQHTFRGIKVSIPYKRVINALTVLTGPVGIVGFNPL